MTAGPRNLPTPVGVKDFSRFNQAYSQILGTPGFLDALNELDDDSRVRSLAQSDPRSYFRSKGVDIPAEASLEFDAARFHLCICIFGACAAIWW
jgi:hypothetical protein